MISVEDKIRGNINVNSNLLDDKVLIKSDGMPTYHFANVVDDHLMKISTVIRGEKWFPSLPFHKLLYKSFKWKTLILCISLLFSNPLEKASSQKEILKKWEFQFFLYRGKKNIGFKEIGFLPNSIINYLALLGWNDDTEKEIYSLKELETAFDFKKIQKSGAKFDYDKAKWINHNHLKNLSMKAFYPFLKKFKYLNSSYKKPEVLKIISLVKERLNLIPDLKKKLYFSIMILIILC